MYLAIILEGPDDTGKSTLANELHHRLALPVIRPHRDWAHWLVAADFYSRLIPPRGIIFDRFPTISEFVYGPILRPAHPNTPKVGGGFDYHVTRSLARMNPIIVWCRGQAGTWELPQLEGVIANNDRIVHEYSTRMERLRDAGLEVIDYDFNQGPEEFEKTWLPALIANIKDRESIRFTTGFDA